MELLLKMWAVLWRIGLFLVVWGILSAPPVLVFNAAVQEPGKRLGSWERLYFELTGAASVMLAAWIMTRFIDRRPFLSLGFGRRGAATDFGAGLALGSAMLLLALVVLWLPGWADAVAPAGFSWGVLALTGTAMLLNSVIQEVLVRGYMLQTIERRFNVPVALVASSVLFTLLHAGAIAEGGILPAVNLFGAGWLLGLAYVRTRNLWLPIGLHFAWNFLQGPLLGIAVSGQALDSGWKMVGLTGPAIFTGGSFGLEAGLAATLATGLGIAVLYAVGGPRGPNGA